MFNNNVADVEDSLCGYFLFTDMSGRYELFLKQIEKITERYTNGTYLEESLGLL